VKCVMIVVVCVAGRHRCGVRRRQRARLAAASGDARQNPAARRRLRQLHNVAFGRNEGITFASDNQWLVSGYYCVVVVVVDVRSQHSPEWSGEPFNSSIRWIEHCEPILNDDDFPALGAAFIANNDADDQDDGVFRVQTGTIGAADATLCDARRLVEFGVEYLRSTRVAFGAM
jgi:hypothetical protein